jgi:BirA family biotin operon repressor/biotin-[acetyl-CoA-carboxylase] ligase
MKSRIYSLMVDAEQPLSGAQLSRSLGVSRVAIWKHIQQMKAAGCDIEATVKGYRLTRKPDRPFAWVFGRRAGRVHYLEEVGSTMNEAMVLAGQGCVPFTVVVSDRQSAGRGRLQREWCSDAGGLYFTIVLRPEVEPSRAPLINLAAAVDLAKVMIDIYGIEARVKWPNDILVQGHKIAGILSQMGAEADRVDFVNVGIGVNVNNRIDAVTPPAASISRLIGRAASRAELLEYFLNRFETRVESARWADVIPQWRQLSATFGRRVTIQTGAERVVGTAVDVEANGGLIVETAPGVRRTVLYGDCFHGGESNIAPLVG